MSLIEKLRSDLESVQTRARQIIEMETRSDAAQSNLDELLAEGQTLETRIAELVRLDSLTAAASTLDDIASGAQTRADASARRTTDDLSMGELFVRSDVFKSYPGRGTSSRMEISERALPMSLGTSADGIPRAQRINMDDPVVEGPLLGLVGTINVSTNSVEAVTWAKVAGGAAVVPEGTAKPSVEWEPTVTPYTLETVAAFTQATRQLLEDAPAVRSFIDTELRREVIRKFESEAAAALVAATLPTATDTTLLKGIRKGIGEVQAAGYNPTAVLLNPADWADLDIDVFGSTLLGPSRSGSFWGLRPVASNAQPAGTATVGDFVAGVQRFVRTGVSLYITDSHASTFTSNIFTLLAEGRAKTVVTRPAALVEVTVTP